MSERIDGVPDKWAVLIGIEYYQHPEQPTTSGRATPRRDGLGNEIKYKTLLGCINDILAVEQYLLDTIKVNPDHITKLLAPCPGRKYLWELPKHSYHYPTYENIVDTLQKVPKHAKKGDFVYVHFSGHGARTTTVFPELKDGGDHAEDQALVPSDITCGGSYLRDLEMGILLQDMVDAGLVVTVVLDCCHSGGAVRGDDDPQLGETRGIPEVYKSDLQVDLPWSMERIRHWGKQPSWLHSPKGFVVLAACLEHQKAAEIARHSHGLLTYCLLSILRNNPVNISSQALYERVCAKVQDSSLNQTPYLVGDKDRFFFSSKVRSHVYALAVRRASVDTFRAVIDRSVHLGGGILHGVEMGSEYAILPLGVDLSHPIQGNHILARVKVIRVMTGECLARFINAEDVRWEGIVEGCPAVLQNLPIVKKSTVHFVTPDDDLRVKFIQNWRQHEGDQAWLTLDGKSAVDAFFNVVIDKHNNFDIRDRSGGSFTAALRANLKPLPAFKDGADSFPRLIHRLEHLARFRMTKELANPGVRPRTTPSLVSITVDVAPEGQYRDSGEWVPPAPTVEWKEGVYELEEMMLFRLAIENLSGQYLGCIIMNCDAEFGIEPVFPLGTPFYSIGPAETKNVDLGMQITPNLRAAVEEDLVIMETLKIFVSAPERDLDSLRLSGLKETEDSITRDGGSRSSWSEGLDKLLMELDTRRLAFSAPSSSSGGFDWETLDIKIRILPRL